MCGMHESRDKLAPVSSRLALRLVPLLAKKNLSNMRRKYLNYLSTYIVHPEPLPFCFTHLKYAGQLVNLYCECQMVL